MVVDMRSVLVSKSTRVRGSCAVGFHAESRMERHWCFSYRPCKTCFEILRAHQACSQPIATVRIWTSGELKQVRIPHKRYLLLQSLTKRPSSNVSCLLSRQYCIKLIIRYISHHPSVRRTPWLSITVPRLSIIRLHQVMNSIWSRHPIASGTAH